MRAILLAESEGFSLSLFSDQGATGTEKVNEKVNGSSGTLKYGASEGTRTLDLRFTKPMLYQLSYAGNFPFSKTEVPKYMTFFEPVKVCPVSTLNLTRYILHKIDTRTHTQFLNQSDNQY